MYGRIFDCFIVRTGIFIYMTILFGCTAVRTNIEYKAGSSIENLTANLNISVIKAETGFTANGVFAYRRPDQIHMVLLSPFGTTILEIFSNRDLITVISPDSLTAYVGTFSDLPQGGFLHGWRLLQWVLDANPSDTIGYDGVSELTHSPNRVEQITFRDGLVVSKKTSNGEEVAYSDYRLFSGVPLACIIDLQVKKDENIRFVLDEPEVNTNIEDIVFIPRLQGLKVLPLSVMPGI